MAPITVVTHWMLSLLHLLTDSCIFIGCHCFSSVLKCQYLCGKLKSVALKLANYGLTRLTKLTNVHPVDSAFYPPWDGK